MANIFILGSEGFIGSHLCRHFVNQGFTVTGCDVTEASPLLYTYHKINILSSDFEHLFAESKFDVCINASGSGNVGYSITHPQSDFDSNTVAVAKIADAIKKQQPACRLLHISSAAVYGNPVSLPVNESSALSPVSPYGYHKLMSELICREYSEIYKMPIIIIRPFSVYGNGLKKQLLWDVCNKLFVADSITLFGTGNETRDFIHIDDLVVLVQLLIEKESFDGNVYNAASGIETSIQTVADIFTGHFPGNKKIIFSGSNKSGDPINWKADISKIKAAGFSPAKNLEEQIKSYISWYCTLHSKG